MREVIQMHDEGWCEGCNCDWNECLRLGYCKGGKAIHNEEPI